MLSETAIATAVAVLVVAERVDTVTFAVAREVAIMQIFITEKSGLDSSPICGKVLLVFGTEHLTLTCYNLKIIKLKNNSTRSFKSVVVGWKDKIL